MYKNKYYNETKEEQVLARKLANKNLEDIEKPRKPIKSSFKARYAGGECPKCFLLIEIGETVRFDEDGVLYHVFHRPKEIEYSICSNCFLAKPCECDE